MIGLSIRLFGGFAVTRDGEPVTGFDSNKVRALLAYLAVEADHAHRRDSLAALLWPDYPDSSARTNLRNALANLRTVIGDREAEPSFLWITRDTLQFNTESNHWLDVAIVTQALAKADSLPTSDLIAAADAYIGDFLAGFTLDDAVGFDDWTATTREGLRRQVLDLLGIVADRLQTEGKPQRALTYAQRRVDLEPWLEAAQQQLIRLLAATGRRSAALRQYRDCVRVLEAELGAEPSAEVVALFEELRGGGSGASSRAAPGLGCDAESPLLPRHSLPSAATPILGREELLAEVDGYLRDPTRRLVTLVGPGGIGKTRLALEVGRRALSSYGDGVFLVSLAEVRMPAGVWSALAKSLGFAPATAQPGQRQTPLPEQLFAYLREKHVLLILDNAEHLLSAAGDDGLRDGVARLLATALEVTLLVTSRERLHMLQEQVVPVGGIGCELENPESEALPLTPAAQLFVEVARRTSPGLAVTDQSRAAIDRVCRAVNGMPLAILLAAGWVDVLTPKEIAEQLTMVDGEAIAILAGDWADLPERHRSLTAVFDGSWALLTSDQQAGFAALSVFAGSFTRSSATAIAGISLRGLRSLVAKSLVEVVGERYWLHPLIREFAAQKLVTSGAQDVVTARHGRYYADWVTQTATRMKGALRKKALAEMRSEMEDAIQAWEWAAELGEVDLLFGMLEGLRESLDWLGRITDALPGIRRAIDRLVEVDRRSGGLVGRDRVLLAYLYGWLSWFAVSVDAQIESLERGIDLLGSVQEEVPSWGRCRAWFSLQQAHAASRSGDHSVALTRAQAACDGYLAAGDTWWQARVLTTMGEFAERKGDFLAAASYHTGALRLFGVVGDGFWETACLLSLGNAYRKLGDLVQAEEFLVKGAVASRRVGDQRLEMNARASVGLLRLQRGQYPEGESELLAARAGFHDLGLSPVEGMTTAAIAVARAQQGHYVTARAVAEEGLVLAEADGRELVMGRCYRAWGQALLACGDEASASVPLERAAQLQVIPPDERADALAILAIAKLRQGELQAACDLAQNALAVLREAGTAVLGEYPLSAAARLVAEIGHSDVGLAIYTAACERLPQVANGRWFEDVVGGPVRATARATLSPEAYRAAKAQGDGLTIEKAMCLAYEVLTTVCASCGSSDA
ncbi:MAG: AAA family ATPase [Anaerolineae bacterium]|nr:AAA family ATPase [Anaerolineae bacterium]